MGSGEEARTDKRPRAREKRLLKDTPEHVLSISGRGEYRCVRGRRPRSVGQTVAFSRPPLWVPFPEKRRQREIEEGFAGEGVLIRGKGSFVLAPPSPIWRANNVCVSVPFVDPFKAEDTGAAFVKRRAFRPQRFINKQKKSSKRSVEIRKGRTKFRFR